MTNGLPLRPVVGKTRTGRCLRNVVIAYGRFLECQERRRSDHRGRFEFFGSYTSQEAKLDGEEYLIMREEDEVLAVMEGASTKKKK